MLEVQKWLREFNCLDRLKDQLGIKSTVHEDGRVILNYGMIDSPKRHKIVRECRGLVLDSKDDWNLVARSFFRFFNLNEIPEETDEFVWENCNIQHKEDGSLLVVYYYKGQWHVNTRASFSTGQVGDNPITFRELALKAIPESFWNNANKSSTYVFELCSLYNKIVRTYQTPTVFLLTVFDGLHEIAPNFVDSEARITGVQRPQSLRFENIEQVQEYLNIESNKDKTFEGVVLRDINNLRIKCKNQNYLCLHRMSNNGSPCSPKNVLPFVLAGELDELFLFFPEVKEYALQIKAKVDKWQQEIDDLWYVWGDIENQKKFALRVKDHPFSGCLFKARKMSTNPVDEFKNNPNVILKRLLKRYENKLFI